MKMRCDARQHYQHLPRHFMVQTQQMTVKQHDIPVFNCCASHHIVCCFECQVLWSNCNTHHSIWQEKGFCNTHTKYEQCILYSSGDVGKVKSSWTWVQSLNNVSSHLMKGGVLKTKIPQKTFYRCTCVLVPCATYGL